MNNITYLIFFLCEQSQTSTFYFYFWRSPWPFWAGQATRGGRSKRRGWPDARLPLLHQDRELPQAVAYHLRLDVHLGGGLAVVDAHHAAHRLRQDVQTRRCVLNHLGFGGRASLLASRRRAAPPAAALTEAVPGLIRRRGEAQPW